MQVGAQRVLALILGQFRVHRIEADQGVVGSAPLQGTGQAGALDLAGGADIARVARHPGVGGGLVGGDVGGGIGRTRGVVAAVGGIDAVGGVGGGVGRTLRRVAQRRAQADGAALLPAHRVVAFLQHVALAVGRRQQCAEAAVGPGVGDQAGHARVELFGKLAVADLGAGRGAEAVVVERARGPQVDSRTQRALVHLRRLGLVDLDRAEQLGGEGVEVEATAAVDAAGAGTCGGQRLQAVQAHAGEVRAQAPDRDALAFAAFAVDRHAGDALHRFGQVLVGELADVLGEDRIDLFGTEALLVQRLLQALAVTGDGDRIQVGGLLAAGGRLGRRRVLRADRGRKCQGDSRGQQGNRCLMASNEQLVHLSPPRVRLQCGGGCRAGIRGQWRRNDTAGHLRKLAACGGRSILQCSSTPPCR